MNSHSLAILLLAATAAPANSLPAGPAGPANPAGPSPAAVPPENLSEKLSNLDNFSTNPIPDQDNFIPAASLNQPKTPVDSPQFFLPFMPLSLQQIQQQQQQLMQQIKNKHQSQQIKSQQQPQQQPQQQNSADKLSHQFWVHPDGSVFRPAPGDISSDSTDAPSKQLSRRWFPGYGPYGGHYPAYPPYSGLDLDLGLGLSLGLHI
ncbi:hypothetical protein DL89DRAFT_269742 [Linderina pennispora]|uniref:Uncharacterized protein n=1 Tax=Linderina pennispora TaxID=61395 RepID=A0A1Y1W1B6_9FUNG|nr:uncharacterized protein DL89DRAFT_269742 [Linderina pennispora]ORX67329.1 hypothetical protein DL89DRAFT_269742 [Linderina pennispora]